MNSKTKSTKRERSRNPRNRQSSIMPPSYIPTVKGAHKFRFVASGARSLYGVQRLNLMNLMLMGGGSTTTYRVLEAIRVKRVSIWGGVPALGSAANTVVLEWSSNQAPSTIHSDSSAGVRAPFVSSKPPKNSSAEWWSIAGSNESEILFYLTLPAGTTVDVDVEYTFMDNAVTVAGPTSGTNTAGRMYFNPLDGNAGGVLLAAGGTTQTP